MRTNELRQTFLDYFASQKHDIRPSASLVPHSDPTLLFTNAGMVPFKHVFAGTETLKDKQGKPVSRATTSQKCVRAGGKHNDLDNVGYTARHHTFFEMLGNFSFGDYFKEDAVRFAWEFLTQTIGLPEEKLYITIYHDDDEAYELWHKLTGFGEDRILRIATNDNFWAMGDTGPCGPCSEIFYDHGPEIAGGLPGTPEEDGDRYIEIWNLVFMQYDRQPDGELKPLPNPCIDTGMGLERMAAVLQGVHDNYDIDLFQAIINESKKLSGKDAVAVEASHRVIADHLRSSAFLLADGVLPSNEGRGYVLRRIMRRAMRHIHHLGVKEPMMHRLFPTLLEEMGEAFPELGRAEALIMQTLQQEETRFAELLDRGLKKLDEETKSLTSGDCLAGETAFMLYDTYGFPMDLTADILRGREIAVDQAGFDAAMLEQKKRARAAWSGSGEQATEEIWFDIKEKHGVTEFLGYEQLDGSGIVQAIVQKGKLVDKVTSGEAYIVTNQTPFYAESGGQAGDKGSLAGNKVKDTKKYLGDLHAHICEINAPVSIGDEVELRVDDMRRAGLRANHSATHLLHAALREVLGEHVTQKGSLVEEGYLRFDFSHHQGLSEEEVVAIEEKVNTLIEKGGNVQTKLMTPDDAIKEGAMALFGEKYGDEVRVLTMGDGDYSVELCGGTHVTDVADVGACVIIKEGSVSSGVRRIEAVAGPAVEKVKAELEVKLKALGGNVPRETSLSKAIRLMQGEIAAIEMKQQEEKKAQAKQEAEARKKQLAATSSSDDAETIAGTAFIGKVMEHVNAKELKPLVDQFKQKLGSGVVTLIGTSDGKVSVVVGVTEDMTNKYDAVTLVRIASETLGGKGGGGRPDMAQAGGSDASKAQAAIDDIKQALGEG